MKKIILPVLILFSFVVQAQNQDSLGVCKAGFRFEVNHEIMTFAPATVLNFYDTSEGDVKEWYWDFGDGGGYVNEQNPMHIFNHPINSPTTKFSPYRTITLTILTGNCKSAFSQTINILDLADSIQVQPQQNCQAWFKYYESGRDANGNAIFSFVNNSVGENLTYLWQFGDGSESTEKEPSKTFAANQPVNKVCLTVFGPDSCTGIYCDDVFVGPVFPGDSTVTDTTITDTTGWHNCYSAFGYNLKDMLMGPVQSAVVEFYSKAYPEPVEWFWDFGDGTTSNEPNPTHVFQQMPGMDSMFNDSLYIMPEVSPYRTVCLTVKTIDECKVSYCQTIRVFEYNPFPEPVGCQAYFKYYKPDDMVSIPEVVPVQLVDVTEGDVVSRLWQFEDGTTSAEKELLKSFSIFQPFHKVCLTVTFADSCVSTFCDAVYVNGVVIDTLFPEPGCPYYIKVDGGFPIEMSSCAGWASANVFLGDSLVTPVAFSWTTGDTEQEVQGLCPAQTYGVKAQMPDGCVVSTEFVLSADGSVSPSAPVNWWLSGESENIYVQSEAPEGYKVEWRLCNGMVIEADSIPLMDINCGDNASNFMLKDSMGNVVYSETILLKGSVTYVPGYTGKTGIKMWPNPVVDELNIQYSGVYRNEIKAEILDVMGKLVTTEVHSGVSGGDQFSIKTGRLVAGIYVCRLSSGGELISSLKFSRK